MVPPELSRWFASCRGTGRTAVSTDCFPEPYIGDLLGEFHAVVLGLNPGRPYPELQSRTGRYAGAIRTTGSYRAWAATWPYLGGAWTDAMGRRNPFHKSRYDWVRQWVGQPLPPQRSHVVIELFPWHSINLPRPFRPDPESVRRYVWAPLAELGPIPVFAFGKKALLDVLPAVPGVEVFAHVPGPGETAAQCGFSAPTREVMIGRVPTGGLLYVANHAGSLNPPPLAEVATHKALAQRYADVT